MQSITRRRIRLFMALVALALPASTSAAPVAASGTWDGCLFAPVFSTAGQNAVGTVGVTVDFSGTLLGTYAGTQRDVIHADGSVNLHGSGTFTGTVAGAGYGTAAFRYEGIFLPHRGGPNFGDQDVRVTWVLVGETGSLASVAGHGTLGGTFDGVTDACDWAIFSGSYDGALNLGP